MTADPLILAPLRYLRVTRARLRSSSRKPLEYFKNILITDGPAPLRKAKPMWTTASPNLKIVL
jgi:hypothetical protein